MHLYAVLLFNRIINATNKSNLSGSLGSDKNTGWNRLNNELSKLIDIAFK